MLLSIMQCTVKKQTTKCFDSTILFCGKIYRKKKYLRAYNSSFAPPKVN